MVGKQGCRTIRAELELGSVMSTMALRGRRVNSIGEKVEAERMQASFSPCRTKPIG